MDISTILNHHNMAQELSVKCRYKRKLERGEIALPEWVDNRRSIEKNLDLTLSKPVDSSVKILFGPVELVPGQGLAHVLAS